MEMLREYQLFGKNIQTNEEVFIQKFISETSTIAVQYMNSFYEKNKDNYQSVRLFCTTDPSFFKDDYWIIYVNSNFLYEAYKFKHLPIYNGLQGWNISICVLGYLAIC